ncbi:MAG: DNA topoisomerase I, partial [Candidatus Diapherotrites archaeon]|nr:DNA topoisomerase I [Candidatus Diapherotrites archaeon]
VMDKRRDVATVLSSKASKRTIPRPVPFHTTDFLRAATTLGMTASKAMMLAESLYMKGFLSYPRTDSNVYPSSLDLKEIVKDLAKSEGFDVLAQLILDKGPLKPSAGKKDAKDHPPIHPATAAKKSEVSADEWKIYNLVVRRFLATLADDAIVNAVKLKLDIGGETFVSNGQEIVEQGWNKFYPFSKIKVEIVPLLEEGSTAKVNDLTLEEKQTKPPAHYSQGTLIKKMSDLNLGTKSTRADIIKKLYDRDFFKGQKAIEPTEMAESMIDALERYGKD